MDPCEARRRNSKAPSSTQIEDGDELTEVESVACWRRDSDIALAFQFAGEDERLQGRRAGHRDGPRSRHQRNNEHVHLRSREWLKTADARFRSTRDHVRKADDACAGRQVGTAKTGESRSVRRPGTGRSCQERHLQRSSNEKPPARLRRALAVSASALTTCWALGQGRAPEKGFVILQERHVRWKKPCEPVKP